MLSIPKILWRGIYLRTFDMVNRMNIGHTIFDNPSNLFQAFVRAHGTNGIALHHDVTSRQKFQSFQCSAIGPQDPLSSFDETLFVRNLISYLDNVGCHAIFQDLDSLRSRNAAGQKFYKVSSIENGGRVIGFPGSPHGHTPFDEIQSACDLDTGKTFVTGLVGSHIDAKTYMMTGERACDQRPCLLQIDLSVFGEKSSLLIRQKPNLTCEAEGAGLTNEDSSLKVPAALSAGVKASSFHLSSVSSLSHGLSFLCVDGMLARYFLRFVNSILLNCGKRLDPWIFLESGVRIAFRE